MNWNGKPYHTLAYHVQELWGEKVYKLSLNGGMTCPNRDGTLGRRGCIFCSAGGSGEFAAPAELPIADQIEKAKKLVENKTTSQRYIAYFQAYTNTHGTPADLEALYLKAAMDPQIAAVSIATRPDCLGDEVLAVLSRLQRIKPVWIELGLQTIHEKTAQYIRRGYALDCFESSLKKLQALSIPVIVHVILGLPHETAEDMIKTVDYLAHISIQGIKLQLLHVLKHTDLAVDYENGLFTTLTMESYAELVVSCIERLPPEIVIHRVSGDGPKNLLIAPRWSRNKRKVLNLIDQTFKKCKTYQGKLFINY